MIVLEQIADRLEGKAIQKLRHEVPHANYFYKAGGRSHPRSRPRSERYSMV
jgi:hypothetical protein